jgi:hypothetical protein
MKLLCMFMIAVMSYAFAPKAEAKGWFLSKDNRQKRKAKRSVKQAKRAEKACGKGKARKCARLKRKSAANKYAGETGDFRGARKMKSASRKMRRAKKACRKGKGRKCDRLYRKSLYKTCLSQGGSRKDCRTAKTQMRKDQRSFRKGFSDTSYRPGSGNQVINGGQQGYAPQAYQQQQQQQQQQYVDPYDSGSYDSKGFNVQYAPTAADLARGQQGGGGYGRNNTYGTQQRSPASAISPFDSEGGGSYQLKQQHYQDY